MLDAAQYVNIAWDAISHATTKNAFNKAKPLNLAGGTDEEVDMMADLLRSFKALNIPVDKSTIDEFVHVDDENSKEFSYEILNDADDVLETMQTVNDTGNEDESNHITVAEAWTITPAQTESNVTFGGFEHMYNKILEVEDQLLCPDVQDEAGIDYKELKNFFKIFQRKLRQAVLEAKRKKERSMHQLTIIDLFKP